MQGHIYAAVSSTVNERGEWLPCSNSGVDAVATFSVFVNSDAMLHTAHSEKTATLLSIASVARCQTNALFVYIYPYILLVLLAI